MLSQAIDIAKQLRMLLLFASLLFAEGVDAQAPAPRNMDEDRVNSILDNERWRFGRKDLGARRKKDDGNRNGNESTSTRSERNTNSNDYYWSESEGDGRTDPNVNPEDVQDMPDNIEDAPVFDDQQYSPPAQFDPPASSNMSGGFIGILKYILIAAGIGLLVYIILQAKGTGVFKGKKAKVIEGPELDDFDEDIHEIEFVSEIEMAVREKNFRKAIRLMFLNALKDLSDQQLIRWKLNKTNYDYIAEMADNKMQRGFMGITVVYEYSWYGDFQITEKQYKKVAVEFEQFNSKLNELVQG
jgi:hypothetical protein